ncbi:MAG: peptide deformylase [Ilumatobacteraceae bacterium]
MPLHHHHRGERQPTLPLQTRGSRSAVVVNPMIEPLDDELVEINEECLSVPNLRGNVMRHVNVRVRYLDRDGARRRDPAWSHGQAPSSTSAILGQDALPRLGHAGRPRAPPGSSSNGSTGRRSSSGSPSSSARQELIGVPAQIRRATATSRGSAAITPSQR